MSAPRAGAVGRARPFQLCDGVRALFTGRAGGFSSGPFAALNLACDVGDDPGAVAANRKSVLDDLRDDLGHGPRRLAWVRQVHGTAVIEVGGATRGQGATQEGDALFTGSAEAAVGVLVADCAPVLVADPVAGLVGAAHAGRRGMAAGVVQALLGSMTGAGGRPERMRAIIGPAICGRCYEVPAAMRDEVAAAVPGSPSASRDGRPAIDLRAGLRAQLAVAGVGAVDDDPRCTAECDDLFSYRRDGTTGRFAGLIWLAQ